MHFGPRPNACLSKCERTYAQTVHFFHLIYIFSPSSFSLSLSLFLSRRETSRFWPLAAIFPQGFGREFCYVRKDFLGFFFFLSPPLFSKRNFPLRGNMDEFIDLDLRRVRKNLFFINLLNFIREGDLYKSYVCLKRVVELL